MKDSKLTKLNETDTIIDYNDRMHASFLFQWFGILILLNWPICPSNCLWSCIWFNCVSDATTSSKIAIAKIIESRIRCLFRLIDIVIFKRHILNYQCIKITIIRHLITGLQFWKISPVQNVLQFSIYKKM